MKLRVRAMALAAGVLWGIVVLLVTLWAVIAERGLTLAHLSGNYRGYSVSTGGAVVGMI